MTQVQIWLTVATVIGVNIGFILGCIWATGRTLDKVQDWKCREAIRNGHVDEIIDRYPNTNAALRGFEDLGMPMAKGGHNPAVSQVRLRPAPPAPIKRV